MIHANPFAEKAAEVFLAASQTFQKLGDLTVNLNANNVDHEEKCGVPLDGPKKEMEMFKQALERFSNDLDVVSESLLQRTKFMLRNDIKRRTLQMGAEHTGGGIGGASTSRTTFKPVSVADASMGGGTFGAGVVVTTNHHATAPNSQSSFVSMPSSNSGTNTAGSSQNADVIPLDNPESPSKQEPPPELFPEAAVTREPPPPARYPTMLKRLVPMSGYANPPPQSLTIRRVPGQASRQAPQTVRLVSKNSLLPANRQRISAGGNYASAQGYTIARQFTTTTIPRGPSISPQLIPANTRPMRQIGQVTADAYECRVVPGKMRRTNRPI
ncbi:Clh-6 [Aphelenchoides fujianensis]|nr:Clh-6 [Aphelenchoides fujianensis]